MEATSIISKLKFRKYPALLLDTAYNKVRNMDRDSLLRQKLKTNEDKIRLITHYNPQNTNLKAILQKYEGLLLMTRKNAIKPEDIQITYSRSPNLRDLLIKSKLYYLPNPPLSQPCWGPRCKTCQHMDFTRTITNRLSHSYHIRGNFNCQSTDIVYAMTCNVCSIQYIGKTPNTINTRARGHESSISTGRDHPVATHYRSYNHTIDDYSLTILDKEQDKNRRLRLEESWMILLDTLKPRGLNGRL